MLLAHAAWGWGFTVADTDPGRAAEYLAAGKEAIELARRLGRPELISAALDAAGAAVQETGGYGAAHRYQEERLRLVPELDDPTEIADIYGTVAWALVHLGEYRRAVDMQFTDYVARSGTRLPATSNRTKSVFQAAAQFRLGEWHRFWPIFTELDAVLDHDRPLPYHSMRLYGIAAYLKEVAGDGAEADRLIELLDRSQASRGEVGVSGARLWIVQTLVRRGSFAEARKRLAMADPVREVQNRDLTLEAWAELIAEEGAYEGAAPIIAEAREWAERSELLALPAFADRLEGRAALAAGDFERGLELLRGARATFVRLEAAWERARTELILADALLASGLHADAAAMAGSALETVAALSAPLETERARDLLGRATKVRSA